MLKVDKIIEYKITDELCPEISVVVKITTIGFPVDEKLEYGCDGIFYDDITKVPKDAFDGDIWDGFTSRLLLFLDDANLRIILDIMQLNDTYMCDKYKLIVDVISAQIEM